MDCQVVEFCFNINQLNLVLNLRCKKPCILNYRFPAFVVTAYMKLRKKERMKFLPSNKLVFI